MSVCFAVNHGCVTTPLVVSTTVLGSEVASVGNGILYSMTIFASLFVAAPMINALGAKASLLCSMFLYCIYAFDFMLAVIFKDVAAVSWAAFAVGSVCGGLAAGAMWTAQGSYFSSTATLLAAAEDQPRTAATASLAGNFAFMYLLCEVGSKLGYSALQQFGVEPWAIGLVYVGLGGLAWVATFWVTSLEVDGQTVNPLSKVWAVTSLWSDANIWLLSPTNLSFGFAAAFMNGYVNSNIARRELGPAWVGALAAITAATAALLSGPLGLLSKRVGKGPLIALGASCFLCVPLCLFTLGCCEGWGWWLIILYLLQGTGRAVYESTNRAIFSDFFAGEEAEGAFANCMLQTSLSFAICFFLQTSLTGCTLASIVLILAALTPVSYACARWVRRQRLRRLAKEEKLRALQEPDREEQPKCNRDMGA
mmetsp:Transcript_13915/g.33174  ORF Transcript_13915/g.33174 Transcript_13915/m.33174 type:complete len:423 (-) Transcript_13915:90-1358(-)